MAFDFSAGAMVALQKHLGVGLGVSLEGGETGVRTNYKCFSLKPKF